MSPVKTIAQVMSEFSSSPGFELLTKRAKKIISDEKDAFWKIEDKVEAEAKRLRAKDFADFWALLECYIINSTK